MSKQWLRAIIPKAYNFYAHVVGWLGKKKPHLSHG